MLSLLCKTVSDGGRFGLSEHCPARPYGLPCPICGKSELPGPSARLRILADKLRRRLYNLPDIIQDFVSFQSAPECSPMPKIKIINEKKEIEVPPGANLRQELLKHGIEVYRGFLDRWFNCRGFGMCGTCWILVKQGMENLSPKTLRERFRLALSLATIGHENEIRLACQCRVLGDCQIEVRTPFNMDGENFWSRPYPNK
jgi:ferredoxin